MRRLQIKNNPLQEISAFRKITMYKQIKSYFVRINQVQQATDEFDELITTETRPYFLKEYEIFRNETVFDNTDRTFPPFKGVSTVDTVKLKNTMDHQYFVPLVSQLRMSIGFYLATLERSIEANNELINQLSESLKKAGSE